MVPNVPDERSLRGCSKLRWCIAHIWFWPTLVVTIVSSLIIRLISCIIFWGTMGSRQTSVSQRHLFLNPMAASVHSLFGTYPARADVSIGTTFFASPSRSMRSGWPCFPNSVASMSMWTTLAPGLCILLRRL